MTVDCERAAPTVRFHDGTAIAYDPPRNTVDPRYLACTHHRVACDCREAERSEDKQEHLAAMDDARLVIAHLIDAPCAPTARATCIVCSAALTTWLHRYGALRRQEVPF